MSKNTLIACLTGFCLVVFAILSYLSFMYLYTQVQLVVINSHVAIYEEMEEKVKTEMNVKKAVEYMEYALYYYYPGGQLNLIGGTTAENLLETLRRNSVNRMVHTLNERFPLQSKGDSLAAWIEAYGNKHNLDIAKETEWYKKWYDKSP